ncbi:MAG: hypothetical protein GWO23_18150 [Gammaproteobacteria bacterium]|nr:hypothetical protein [Gammaproteobacteria bacterium]NIW45467.1 hypothetical protein [Gammaproteobacteria bacterium]
MKPSDLIRARNEAFQTGDFGLIYDSYHSESNFCRQFPDREEYISLGKTTLAQDYQIKQCQIVVEAIADNEARVIFLMDMVVNGAVQQYAELSWFLKEGGRWYYLRGLKMPAEDLPENPETLEFRDFDRLDPNTIF